MAENDFSRFACTTPMAEHKTGTTRAAILDAAKKCVCGERDTDYGVPENNFATIAELWRIYTDTLFTSEDVAMMLALVKIARIKQGNTPDSYVDLAGYAACAGELANGKENKNGQRD